MPLKQVIINNEVFVPRIQLAEALDIIAELSELYDQLAANPSEPTPDEKRAERRITRRWTRLQAKAYPKLGEVKS
jgi:hypothetical protein